MNLQHLERFVVLAKERNYTRAAESLQIPQPYLSKQIQQLESDLGAILFDRKKPLSLTLAGTIFLQEVEAILNQIKQAKTLVKRSVEGEIGQLVIGINTSISNSLLPLYLQNFREKFPDVKIILKELLVEDSQRMLQEGSIDINFENVRNLKKSQDGSIQHEIIYQESLVVVLPQHHRLVHQRAIHLQDLDGEAFVMPSQRLVTGLYTIIRELCDREHIQLKVVQEATWMTTVLALVAGGLGASLLPANAVNLQRTGVVYREIPELEPMFKLAVTWRTQNGSQVLQNFLEIVRQVSISRS